MHQDYQSPAKYVPEYEGSCASSSTSGIGDMGGATSSSVQKDNIAEEKVSKERKQVSPPKAEEIKSCMVMIPNPGGTKTCCRPSPSRRKSKPYKSGIGRSTADKLQTLSWLWDEKVDLMKCFKYVMSANEKDGMKTMTSKDLQEVLQITPGEIASGIVTHVKDPSEFFVVLEKKEIYCLDNRVWKEFFPCFQTGPEAHRGLIQLLNVFYKLSTSLGELTNLLDPEIGSLVALKLSRSRKTQQVVSKKNKKSAQHDLVHQMRRGMIVDVVNDTKRNQTLYCVYLLDYGFEVTVSTDCLYPLYKPFNCIAPLAIKCGLFGVSPIGENWSAIAVRQVKHTLQKYSTATLSIQFYSSANYFTLENPTLKLYASSSHIVNMEVHKFSLKTGQVEFVANFAEDLVKDMLAIPWNLTPSRPKLMEGTDIPPVEIIGSMPGTRLTISIRDGLLLTDFHPRVYQPLSAQVLKREVERLFRLRGVDMCDVLGMHNRLVIFLEDPNGDLQKPSTIALSWNKDGRGVVKETSKTQNEACLLTAEDEKHTTSNIPFGNVLP